MRSVSTALQTLLTGNVFVLADLYDWTVRGTTYYLTNSDRNISWNGHTYAAGADRVGPTFTRNRVRQTASLQLDDLEITVYHGGAATIGDVTWAQAALRGHLDNATVLLQRAYLDPANSYAVVGALEMFSGTVGIVEPASTSMRVTVRSAASQMDRKVPRNIMSQQCSFDFMGPGCAYPATGGPGGQALWTNVAGSSGGTDTATTIYINQGRAADYFNGGFVTVTAGGLTGYARQIVSSAVVDSTHHSITISPPLPSAPDSAARYTIARGCDKWAMTCRDQYGWLVHHQSFPCAPRSDEVA